MDCADGVVFFVNNQKYALVNVDPNPVLALFFQEFDMTVAKETFNINTTLHNIFNNTIQRNINREGVN